MTSLLPKLPHVLYGGDYNPEQWPESVWAEDVRLMREAGVNLVSVAIFSWAKLQPAEKRWDFGWLDRLLDLLAENGVHACLATATASPPAWLCAAYPDVLVENPDGSRNYPGARQHYCPSSPSYRRFSTALVRKIARRYAGHPALAAWHINNEYGCHTWESHTPAATASWRLWLKSKYRTLEALNQAWGTSFWSQAYGEWEHILTPRKIAANGFINPTQRLDFYRFMSDEIQSLFEGEAALVRELAPGVPVTTNFIAFHPPIDTHRWAPGMDFVSWDSYPDPTPGAGGEAEGARGHDLMRAAKPGRAFVLMEQVTSLVNWRPVNAVKRPGQMRLWSYQALARGAEGVMFFQWRASRFGAEKFHGAMIPHAGVETRVFREVRQVGQELRRLDALLGSQTVAEVALLNSWDNTWAAELASHPRTVNVGALLAEHHAAFFRANLTADIAPPSADLSRYKVIVLPHLMLLSATDAARLERWTAEGGVLLVTYFSGIVDEHDHIQLDGYPALLRKTLGLWVEEWDPLPEHQPGAFREIGRNSARQACRDWSELVHLEGAEARARFTEGVFADQPALTEHAFGRGRAWYLATRPSADFLDSLVARLARQAGLVPALTAPAGVEVVERRGPRGERFLFLLNHTEKEQRVSLGRLAGRDLLTDRPLRREARLEPRGVVLLHLASSPS